MYFSKRLMNKFSAEIIKSNSLYFDLKIGLKDLREEELKEGIETIFFLLSKISQSNFSLFRQCQGCVRKLVIDCNEETKTFSPYFNFLLQVDFSKVVNDEFEVLTDCRIALLRDVLYYRWLKAWLYTSRREDILFDLQILDKKDDALSLLQTLCGNEKKENKIIKNICKIPFNHHRLTGLYGNFYKIVKSYRGEKNE